MVEVSAAMSSFVWNFLIDLNDEGGGGDDDDDDGNSSDE